MEFQLKNNTFHLLPEKAIFWKEQNILLISDLHIGKISHFRKEGIAVPRQAADDNFTRLTKIVSETRADRIIFIGDLFHSSKNEEWEQFCEWRHSYPEVKMDIVLGNHDQLPKTFCDEYKMEIYPKDMLIDPFVFAHHPNEKSATGKYRVSGHVHPVIRLHGSARQHAVVPCFYFGVHQAILPSFGHFTGSYSIDVGESDSVIAVVKNKLIPVQVNHNL